MGIAESTIMRAPVDDVSLVLRRFVTLLVVPHLDEIRSSQLNVHPTLGCVIPGISTVLKFFIKTTVKSITNPFTKVNIVGTIEVWLTEW